MFEHSYINNPFMLKNSTDEELCREINNLAGQYKKGELPYEVVFNIELESDMLTIYGEMIARLQEQYSLKKLEADSMEAKTIYQLRNDWLKSSADKPPAIDYFKAQANGIVKDLRIEQYKNEAMLTRFKKAYTSLESKQNALKKKLDAMKYEQV